MASYSWLGNFDLLKYSCTDIMQKPWTVPANHEVANKYFKVLCAQEEIHHLNVEVHRLDEWVSFEDQTLAMAAKTATDPHLAVELHCHYAEHQCVNNIHHVHIFAIYKLDGYSGPGHYIPPSQDEERPTTPLDDQDDEEGLIDKDDRVQDEVLRLGDFLDSLTIN